MKYLLNSLRGSWQNRQNHSIPNRCNHSGHRSTVPASKSTVAPSAINNLTFGICCRYLAIHTSCFGDVAHTTSTVADLQDQGRRQVVRRHSRDRG